MIQRAMSYVTLAGEIFIPFEDLLVFMTSSEVDLVKALLPNEAITFADMPQDATTAEAEYYLPAILSDKATLNTLTPLSLSMPDRRSRKYFDRPYYPSNRRAEDPHYLP